MRPTIYNSSGIQEQPTIYLKLSVYESYGIYNEFVDPQNYDPDDIPDEGLGVVPLDPMGWATRFDGDREQDAATVKDPIGWATRFDGDREQDAAIVTDLIGWGVAIMEASET